MPYRTKWKVHQDAENWVDLKSAHDQGYVFWETLSNAIILNDSVPADCLVEVVVRKSSGGSLFMVHGPWFMVDYLVGSFDWLAFQSIQVV